MHWHHAIFISCFAFIRFWLFVAKSQKILNLFLLITYIATSHRRHNTANCTRESNYQCTAIKYIYVPSYYSYTINFRGIYNNTHFGCINILPLLYHGMYSDYCSNVQYSVYVHL